MYNSLYLNNESQISLSLSVSTSLIKVLISNGANVNKITSGGQTALMEASCWGHADVVQALIVRGEQFNYVPSNLVSSGISNCFSF